MVHLNYEYKIQRKTIYRQGSVLVTIVIGFYQYLTPYDVRQATINLVKAVQEQPPSSSNDLIEKIDLSYIMVSERRGN